MKSLLIAGTLITLFLSYARADIVCTDDSRATDGPLSELRITKRDDGKYLSVISQSYFDFTRQEFVKKDLIIGEKMDCGFSDLDPRAFECRDLSNQGIRREIQSVKIQRTGYSSDRFRPGAYFEEYFEVRYLIPSVNGQEPLYFEVKNCLQF